LKCPQRVFGNETLGGTPAKNEQQLYTTKTPIGLGTYPDLVLRLEIRKDLKNEG